MKILSAFICWQREVLSKYWKHSVLQVYDIKNPKTKIGLLGGHYIAIFFPRRYKLVLKTSKNFGKEIYWSAADHQPKYWLKWVILNLYKEYIKYSTTVIVASKNNKTILFLISFSKTGSLTFGLKRIKCSNYFMNKNLFLSFP